MRTSGSHRQRVADATDSTAAMEIAVRFLGARPRTRWELDRRLRRGGVEAPVIEATLDRLTELGYVDDAAFARWWGDQRDRHAPRGRRMIEAELRQRGVAREVIDAFRIEHVAPDRVPQDEAVPGTEEDRAAEALARHLKGRPLPADARARQRIGMFLVRRGFDPETVRNAIRHASTPDDDDGVDDA